MWNRVRELIINLKPDPNNRVIRSLRAHGGVGLTAVLVFSILGSAMMLQSRAATADMFVFGTGGDHAANVDTPKVFQGVGAQNLDFFLSLGDLSYDETTPANWCQMVKDNINIGAGKTVGDVYGENYPFQLTLGNHDITTFDQYLACLPDRMASTAMEGSTYGRDYYYDYPSGSPFARFIVMAPSMQYTMKVGSPEYIWLGSKIDQARANGIKWVIVASHHNYIMAGDSANFHRGAFFNLLVEKKVDLAIQGHEHNYQRSHQLALGPDCTTVPREPANTACISGNNPSGIYKKGNGLLTMIVGTAGQDGNAVDTAALAAPYFAKLAGAQGDAFPSGFSKITVTPTSLRSTFINTNGGNLVDDFEITADTSAPSPTPTPPSPAPVTRSFPVVADATIKQNYPATNFGTAGRLQVDGSPVVHSLSKFTVSGTAGYTVSSAKLRMLVDDASPVGGSVYRTMDTSWQESTVTWSTAPVAEATAVTTIGAVTAGQWVEADVTSMVQGDGTYSVRIASTNGDLASYYATNAASNKPQLVLDLVPESSPDVTPPSEPTGLTATPLSSSQIGLTWTAAEDDRYVKEYRVTRDGTDIGVSVAGTTYTDTGLSALTSYTYNVAAVDGAGNTSPLSNTVVATTIAVTQSATTVVTATADASLKKKYPTTNYGVIKALPVDTSPLQNVLLKFDVGGLGGKPVKSAKLRLYVTNASPTGGTLYPVTDSSWSESTVTWNTAPAAGTVAVASFGAVAANTWAETDVTVHVNQEGTYSLSLVGANSDVAAFNSRESVNKPQLVITY